MLLRRLREAPRGASQRGLLGRCDQAALATALTLRPQAQNSTVVAIAGGPAERENAVLDFALSSGVDRAIRVFDPMLDQVDYHSVAMVLAKTVSRAGFDLVLVGDSSEEEMHGVIGPAVAEWLRIPHVSGVHEVRVTEDGQAILATRRDSGVRTLRLPVPALLTILSCPNIEVAVNRNTGAPTETVELATLGVSAAELKHREPCKGHTEAAPTRPGAIMLDPGELVLRLRRDRVLDRTG